MVAWLVFTRGLKMETLMLLTELFMALLTEFDSNEILLEPSALDGIFFNSVVLVG